MSVYYSPKQAAKKLGLHEKTVRGYLLSGRMRGRRKGGPNGHWQINSLDLARYEKTEMPYNDSSRFDEMKEMADA